MNSVYGDKMKVVGTVERRLFDTNTYNRAVRALENGDKKLAMELFDKAAKPMFASNRIWKFIMKHFGVDLKLPMITGFWTTKVISANLVTTRGKQIIAEQINGVTTAPVTAIAIGTGSTSPVAGDTALGAESTTNGGSRGAATASSVTTTTTKDTMQLVKTFTFTGSLAIAEEGLFDNNSTGGNMLARQTFSTVNVVNTDTLQITHKVALS